MKFVQTEDVRRWLLRDNDPAECFRSIGAKQVDGEFVEETFGVPFHLQVLWERLRAEAGDQELPANALDSLPFYSLCRGLFLPLSSLEPSRVASLFGLIAEAPPDTAAREQLLVKFLQRDCGLTLEEKLGCILGDPFLGKRGTVRRDSLLRLLMSVQMRSRREMLDRLVQVGDVAVLFAEGRPSLRSDPPLTAAEVLRTLRFLPGLRTNEKFSLLRELWGRCGKLEAYFLAKLLLRKAGFGFDYQGPLLAKLLATQFGATEEQVGHAMALTDVFHVARVLKRDGIAGLRAIQLQPLVPVRPALAGGVTEEIEKFPVWVERKYDGIRLMLHKSTDQSGAILCGAYTRTRGDWLELVPGLDATIKQLPASTVILDGELYGTVLDLDGVRPASVYEVHAALQGQPERPVNLKFAAFDIIYWNGQDLTGLPLSDRRQRLQILLSPIAAITLPIPLTVAEGQLAQSKEDLNRLYHHFRAQGYEGIIAKDLAGAYLLAARDPAWRKRKPEITLDLAILGATYAVTSKENAGLFGSFVIGARTATGAFEIVGDVAGIDAARELSIRSEILRDGLPTGRRIDRPSASGTRPGIELRPQIVVTVKFEGVVRDQVTGKLSLRDPKIASLRADKSAFEADSIDMLQEIYLRQRVG